MDKVQALLQALREGHNAITDKGMQLSNVARLSLGMPELYPEQPTGPLREMGHNYEAWNWLRQKMGLSPIEDPNAVPVYSQGRYIGPPAQQLSPEQMPKINLPYSQ